MLDLLQIDISAEWVPLESEREIKFELVSAIDKKAYSGLFELFMLAGSLDGPTITKSLYMSECLFIP